MFDFVKRFLPRPSPRITPEFDQAILQKLEGQGKKAQSVVAEPAEPLEIPSKPALPGFQGMIRFELTLSADGQVVAVQMDGAPFAQVGELEAWAHAWTFRPASLEGQAHACRMVFEVHWTPEAS